MKQLGLLCSAAAVIVFLTSGAASAQAPVNPPPVSPYLNLMRGGNPAINYYGLVRPQVEFRQSMHLLQQQVDTELQSRPGPSEPTEAAPTGTGGKFGTHLRYFGTRGFVAAPGPSFGGASPIRSNAARPSGSLVRPVVGGGY